jgi:hypothetical protein
VKLIIVYDVPSSTIQAHVITVLGTRKDNGILDRESASYGL